VAVGDFNADGKLDLGVAANVYFPGSFGGYDGNYWYPGYYEGHALVLLGTGGGNFSDPSDIDLGTGYQSAAIAADLNADGLDDFVTVNADYGYVSAFLGDSSGTLQGPSGFSTGFYCYSLAAGDLNADGHTDLVTGSYDHVWVLMGDGDGAFAAPQQYGDGGGITSVALGDFNRDGKLDIATAKYDVDSVGILRGLGDGTFPTTETFAAGPGAYRVVAGDFNGDSWIDAATANIKNDTVSVLANDHSWPFVPPTASVGDATVTEGNTGTVNATFTLNLSYPSVADVTVHYVTADITAVAGSDYVAASGDVTIPAGQTSATFAVAVKGDRVAESSETFAVNLSAPANATIADGQGVGTIVDDEQLISINDVSVTEGNSGTRAANLSVSLSTTYDVPVTVAFAAANGSATAGSDYQAASGTLTIPAGQTTGTVTVQVIGDRVAEANESFFVNLSNPNYGTITDTQGLGTIVDDEPRISISDFTKSEGKKNQTTLFTFTVTLSAAYDQAVTLSYRTTDGTATSKNGNADYVAKTGTLTFAPGEITETITIEVKGDNQKESNETFYVDLFGNSGNSLFTKSRGIGTILNDD
jgi:hypothetical protein